MKPDLIATYRLQLRPGFGFEEVAARVKYLSKLGVSHVYTSPYLQAAKGSQHGYDVVEASRVSEDLGGPGAHAVMCQTIKSMGLGHVLDIVPNHMAIAGRQNPWWWDVLENGMSSLFATYFDVDWENTDDRWPNKILLPVLGDHYGRVLERGEFSVTLDTDQFVLSYFDHQFPIDPSTFSYFLKPAAVAVKSADLEFLAVCCDRLPSPTVTQKSAVKRRHSDKSVVTKLILRLFDEQPYVVDSVRAQLSELNSDYDSLDELIQLQNYRLAYWRTANRDLGYRRFFDITELAGVRVEIPEVFNDIHALPLSWVSQGLVQGLRVDHPDGLRNPKQYFCRLAENCPDVWIVAEKILEYGEQWPSDWPISGTTGYDFLNLCNGLFVDRKSEQKFNEIYERFCPEFCRYDNLLMECKRLILNEYLSSELNRLTNFFVEICESHRRHRDYTSFELREALCETAVYFPVYRSYVIADNSVESKSVSERDVQYIECAIKSARQSRQDLDPELFTFLKEILLLQVSGSREGELAMRFQQLTGPAMAKGAEDTAFYRFNRLVCLNEVGGSPERFGIDVETFHHICQQTQSRFPHTMTASTTHDTKRSEDVRARLAVLSEIPDEWGETVTSWLHRYDSLRQGEIPDANTIYLLLQTLVGTWPITRERAWNYLQKAVREAKQFTSWTQPDESYEKTLRDYMDRIMDDIAFTADMEILQSKIQRPAWINSLSATLIRLMAPGVPDIYQGTELWDLSLVDPDNRRPVDFDKREMLLDELCEKDVSWVMNNLEHGAPKLWLIKQALSVRRQQSQAFGKQGSYTPILAAGGKAEHVIAFLRSHSVMVLATRLNYRLAQGWQDTTVTLPSGRWRNRLTNDVWEGGRMPVSVILERFPVALLVKE